MQVAISEHMLRGAAAERFDKAKALGADGVELRFGPYDVDHHPLSQPGQPAVLRSQAKAAGLALPSVYGGFFHQQPLHHPDRTVRLRGAERLDRLLDAAAEAGAHVFVLPLFVHAEVPDAATVACLAEALLSLAEKAGRQRLVLGLETVLPAAAVQALLGEVRHPAVGIAYDVGHAAALGYDVAADLKLLGDAVCQVRVHDRSADGRRVPLGQGVLALPALAALLAERGFQGWSVLEHAARDDTPNRVQAEVRHLRQALAAAA